MPYCPHDLSWRLAATGCACCERPMCVAMSAQLQYRHPHRRMPSSVIAHQAASRACRFAARSTLIAWAFAIDRVLHGARRRLARSLLSMREPPESIEGIRRLSRTRPRIALRSSRHGLLVAQPSDYDRPMPPDCTRYDAEKRVFPVPMFVRARLHCTSFASRVFPVPSLFFSPYPGLFSARGLSSYPGGSARRTVRRSPAGHGARTSSATIVSRWKPAWSTIA